MAAGRRRQRTHPRPQATPEERQVLFDLQDGRCAICGRGDVPLFIDHSYRTGRTRGLLSRTCNTGLGQFRDSPTLVRLALQYLLRPPARLLAGSA
jgi:hypothetical protein